MVLIAVIGAGLLGVKIAGELASHGHHVRLFDTNLSQLSKVCEVLKYDAKQLHAEGLLSQEEFVGQVFCMSHLEEAVRDVELILEAVVEDLNIKRDIFQSISEHCKENAIIASNTMSLDINQVIDKATGMERTLGLRFLYPVYCIPEVEICPARVTAVEVIEKVRRTIEKMGKTLFFRSGRQPLVLSEKERDDRKQARKKELVETSGLNAFPDRRVPYLKNKGSADAEKMHNDVYSADVDRDCAICMERLRDCLLQPCHHLVTCYPCGKMLQDRHDACPICRKDIDQTIRVFHT